MGMVVDRVKCDGTAGGTQVPMIDNMMVEVTWVWEGMESKSKSKNWTGISVIEAWIASSAVE